MNARLDEAGRQQPVLLALLIDAENIRAEFVPIILREASANGSIAVRRVYGDFSGTAMKSWNGPVHAHSLTPVHVPPRAQGKNAADMKLAIDAMDLLHQGNLQGFCIASSDSDFTTLANRIRENGLAVFGFGEQKATAPYKAACNRFFYCDLLLRTEQQLEVNTGTAKTAQKLAGLSARPEQAARTDTAKTPELPVEEILAAVDDTSGEDGWAHLGSVGSILNKRRPDFDSRNHGFKKLSDLVARIDGLEMQRKQIGGGQVNLIRRKP